MTLEDIIKRIREQLEIKDGVREKVLESSRTVVRTTRQAILLVHRKRLVEAEKRLEEAKSSLEEMGKHLSGWKELGNSGAVYTAYQEYAEAKILLNYVQSGQIPGPKSIEVPGIPYLLGLADVIGELRRLILDSIRAEEFEVAERSLITMEEIHTSLMTIEVPPAITPGLRKKNDSMRRLIEITRGDVTMEARRRSIERSLVELQSILGEKRNERKKRGDRSDDKG